MADFITWPFDILRPAMLSVNQNAFTRASAPSLSGITRTIRTDRGHFSFDYKNVMVNTSEKRRKLVAMRTFLNGRSGLIAIPVWSYDVAPWPLGTRLGRTLRPFSDQTTFSDGTMFLEPSIVVTTTVTASLQATSITVQATQGIENLEGVRFSYNHALYETGAAISRVGSVWELPIFPDIRAAIPMGASLEFDRPTCLVHLASDQELDLTLSAGSIDKIDVSFVEAVDYWNDLALA